MILTRHKHPAIVMESDAFQVGFDQASKNEPVGWNIAGPPDEDKIVQFLCEFLDVVNSDLASGNDCDYEIRWMAGLLAGFLLRDKG